ncbi:50S ribosomal protein L1 [Candidatus Mycoplasma mahonii]|uniref:50S ribosomal protein L1 n=1 Tax=Candidatus Mycoplasma mahonii TaxID=3004105 RepID=UPI0026F2FB0C|nr:50S ribosomal protein L1 [Candidatus Mycoplasma mahonii]WKX02655.1 50S ribosomal protein L1 [Candidatus Mycoplasma mahonii]
MAIKLSKNLEVVKKLVNEEKFYKLDEAITLAKKTSFVKFDATLDIAFKLNLDTKQADQQLRGSVSLPNGTGKSVKVLAATEDAEAQKSAKTAGADIVVGTIGLTEILKSEKFDFDLIVTDPKMMPTLGRFGKALGPKGLMPNPKTGTVTPNLAKAIKEIKKGKANYRTEKNGIIHTIIGKVSMDDKKLLENANVIFETIMKLKPNSIKGNYLKTFSISTTMGPSIKILIER